MTEDTPREAQFVSELTDWAAQTGKTLAEEDHGVAEVSKRRARLKPLEKNVKKQQGDGRRIRVRSRQRGRGEKERNR